MSAKKEVDGTGGNPKFSPALPHHKLGEPMEKFKGYDLVGMGVPTDARCREGGVYNGTHGYTIVGRNNAASCSITHHFSYPFNILKTSACISAIF